MKKALKNPGVQAFVASIICIILGLLIGYIVLLFINPQGAAESITNVIKNFFTWSKPKTQLKQFGNTLAKTMPLLMCSLSILFAYKVGLFNIGLRLPVRRPRLGLELAAVHAVCDLCRRRARRCRRHSESLLQCQRGNLRHHAELDLSILRQYHSGKGQRSRKPLYHVYHGCESLRDSAECRPG